MVLFVVNRLKIENDEQLKRRVKNAIVLVPGVLFFASGLHTIHDVFLSISGVAGAAVHGMEHMPQSLIPIYVKFSSKLRLENSEFKNGLRIDF